MKDQQLAAVIVAAGSGLRMGGDLPKQLQLLDGIPLAIHPGLKFRAFHSEIELIYVVSKSLMSEWQALLEQYFPSGGWKLAEGGNTRYGSVKNGLALIRNPETLVAIHDGARPFISPKNIRYAFESAFEFGTAVLAVPSKDSIRKMNPDGTSSALRRDEIFCIQTPQIFWQKDLQSVYKQPDNIRFTDDATVMELAGYPIHLVEGSYQNIKVTTPEDWQLAELFIDKNNSKRVGVGV